MPAAGGSSPHCTAAEPGLTQRHEVRALGEVLGVAQALDSHAGVVGARHGGRWALVGGRGLQWGDDEGGASAGGGGGHGRVGPGSAAQRRPWRRRRRLSGAVQACRGASGAGAEVPSVSPSALRQQRNCGSSGPGAGWAGSALRLAALAIRRKCGGAGRVPHFVATAACALSL